MNLLTNHVFFASSKQWNILYIDAQVFSSIITKHYSHYIIVDCIYKFFWVLIYDYACELFNSSTLGTMGININLESQGSWFNSTSTIIAPVAEPCYDEKYTYSKMWILYWYINSNYVLQYCKYCILLLAASSHAWRRSCGAIWFTEECTFTDWFIRPHPKLSIL